MNEHEGSRKMHDDAAELVGPKDYFAVGEPAEHAHGVLYQAEWETEHDGTAVAARLHARALAAQGIPVLLKSFTGMVVNTDGVPEPVFAAGLPEAVRAEVGKLPQTSIQTLSVIVRHLVVSRQSALENYLMPRHVLHSDPEALMVMRRAMYESTITYTVWERDRIAQGIAAQLARCGQNWVPCRQNAMMLIASGVPADKVYIVPHPYEPTDPICKLIGRRPYEDRRFYAIGRWEPRKGLHELIGAFMQAFRPGDSARLTIKTSGGKWKGYPSPDESVAQWLKTYDYWTPEKLAEQVTVDVRRYPRSKILKLHFDNNVYVLPSHGEAWALPAFEAKLAGNRLIHVPYGGTADYCDTEDVSVPFGMEPVHPSYGWGADAEWASFTVDALAAALQKTGAPSAFSRPSYYERIFGFDAVGRQMATLILQLLDRVDPKAAGWLHERAAGRP